MLICWHVLSSISVTDNNKQNLNLVINFTNNKYAKTI